MNIKYRLVVMNFLEFFVWGSWLISLGGYMIVTLKFTGVEDSGLKTSFVIDDTALTVS